MSKEKIDWCFITCEEIKNKQRNSEACFENCRDLDRDTISASPPQQNTGDWNSFSNPFRVLNML